MPTIQMIPEAKEKIREWDLESHDILFFPALRWVSMIIVAMYLFSCGVVWNCSEIRRIWAMSEEQFTKVTVLEPNIHSCWHKDMIQARRADLRGDGYKRVQARARGYAPREHMEPGQFRFVYRTPALGEISEVIAIEWLPKEFSRGG